jgi:hypothetical protein
MTLRRSAREIQSVLFAAGRCDGIRQSMFSLPRRAFDGRPGAGRVVWAAFWGTMRCANASLLLPFRLSSVAAFVVGKHA